MHSSIIINSEIQVLIYILTVRNEISERLMVINGALCRIWGDLLVEMENSIHKYAFVNV